MFKLPKVFILAILAILIFGKMAPVIEAAEKVFLIDFSIQKTGTILSHIVRVVEGSPSIFSPTPVNAEAVVMSLDNRELFRLSFYVEFGLEIFGADSEEIDLDHQRVALKLPYYLTARRIDIYYQGVSADSIDLEQWLCSTLADNQCSEFCKLKGRDPDCRQCGNGLCESGENSQSCALDCSAAVVPVQTTRSGGVYVLAIALGIIVAFGAGGFWLFSRHRR